MNAPFYDNGRGFTATALGAPAGLGALSDPAVQQAAGDLLNYLQGSGCSPSFDPTVQAFQQAYVSAGGNLPNDSDGSSGIDGLYGAHTQAALQAVLDAGPNQPGQAAPAGCVPAGGGGGGGGNVVVPPQTVPGTTSSTGMSTTTKVVLVGAALVGVGIIGYALYKKNKKVRVVHLRKV